jgi:hypothetical protein
VALLTWAGCTWRWEALVHPHEKVELIVMKTMRKYDLQKYYLFAMMVDDHALQVQLCKQDETNE